MFGVMRTISCCNGHTRSELTSQCFNLEHEAEFFAQVLNESTPDYVAYKVTEL